MSLVNKKGIVDFMKNMGKEPVEFKNFRPDEQQYILFLIQNQRGCIYETNGTESDPETITKFRKLDLETILNEKK